MTTTETDHRDRLTARLEAAEAEVQRTRLAWLEARDERDRIEQEFDERQKPPVSAATDIQSAVMRAMDRHMDSGWKLATSDQRTRAYVHARRCAILAMRECGMTYQDIGRALGLDHTTVIYHHKSAADHERAQGRIIARTAQAQL